jgi:hypothetical protein
MPARKRKAAFVEPMLLLRADNLPEGDAWQYELKFDGYRELWPSRPAARSSSDRATTTISHCAIRASQKLFRRFRTKRSLTAKSSPSIYSEQTVM